MSAPFSRKFVLDVTIRAVRHAIVLSISRTGSRVPEFVHDQQKQQELQETLRDLSTMLSVIDALKFD